MKPLLGLAAPLLRATTVQDAPALLAATSAPSESDTGITHRQLALFILTYLAYVAIYFARKPVSVIKSTLESELGMSRSALGGIDTALLTCYATSQFMTGKIVSVFGRSLPLSFGYLACGLLTAGMGMVSEARTMSVLWGLVGIFSACVHPLLVLFVADLFPASIRATMIGLWQTSQQVGGVVANTVTSGVLKAKGWRAAFKVSGSAVASFAPILAAVLLTSSPATPAPPAKAKAAATKAAAGGTKDGGLKGGVLSLPGLTSVGAAYTLVKMSRYCLMFWLPYFLTRHVGIDSATSGVMAAVFDVAGVLGSVVTGILCDGVFGGKMIATVVPFIGASAVAFAGWGALCLAEKARGGAPMTKLHMVAMALVGFAIAGPDGVLGGAASRNLCDYAGRSRDVALAAAASGAVNGFGSVGSILQGGLTAQLVDAAGWSGLFFALAASMALSAAAVLPATIVEAEALAKPAAKKK